MRPALRWSAAVYPVSEGEEIKVFGMWKTHPRYGQQFQADHWEKVDPATLEGIEKYLGSGMIKGIGPTYARRLVDAFGLETLRILSQEPHRVLEVEGIGAARARGIMQAWEAQRGMQDIMVFLQGHGIGAALALKIYRFYGLDTIRQVKDNPYALARDIYGVGFVLADRIAARLGISGDFPLRVQAGVLHILKEFVDQGHCFVLFSALIRNAAALLRVGEDVIENAVGQLAASGDVILEETTSEERAHVYLSELYRAEQRVADALHRLLSSPSVTLGAGGKPTNGSSAEPRELIGLADLNSSINPLLFWKRNNKKRCDKRCSKRFWSSPADPEPAKPLCSMHYWRSCVARNFPSFLPRRPDERPNAWLKAPEKKR